MRSERIKGAWLGLAAGDRIGGPLRMALCLGETLLSHTAYNHEAILDNYLSWWRSEGFDTGLIVHKVFKHIEQGIEPKEAVLLVHQELKGLTGGCNPMHRSLALALCPFLDEDALLQAALDESKLSHHDPIAGEASQAYLLLLRHIINDNSLEDSIAACEERFSSDLIKRMKYQLSPTLSRGGYAPDILETALFFVREKHDFQNCLASSLGFAGAENFSPVILGAIAGALYGAKAIPTNALKHCHIVEQVETIADRFVTLWE
jgi:ADP-ribosylglycohydrolase